MVSISLNSVVINENFQGPNTLKDLVNHVAQKHIGSETMITGVKINQENIYGSGIFSDERSFGPNDQIQFFTQNRLELVFHLLDKSSLYLDQLIDKTSKVSAFYAQGLIDQADLIFLDLMDTMDIFIELMTNIHRTVRIELSAKMSSGKSFHDLEIHLLSVLKAVLKAKEKQDIIMLYDLIEYELLDNLKQWKIIAIPELRNLKTM
ncbi:MAG: hypothetical protein ACOYL6_04785 [Bacteriovoracaceae bacterium]